MHLRNKEIVDALNASHAGAVFLHEGFYESWYCQHECGWLLGRGIPVARLMLGESPRALLGSLQGKELRGRTAAEVCEFILEWAVGNKPLQGHLATSLSTALEESPSFRSTDKIWHHLSQVDRLTSEQLRRVISAAEHNSQIYQARARGSGGQAYRRVIADKATVWDAEGFFSDRITRLRDPNPTRPIPVEDDG